MSSPEKTAGPFRYETAIVMRHTDAAGVMFFARLFELLHDAFEAFLGRHQVSPAELVGRGDYLMPIAHVQADYKQPLPLGEQVTVDLRLAKTGRCSFTLTYEVRNGEGTLAATAETVHVPVSKKTLRPVKLPEAIRAALDSLAG